MPVYYAVVDQILKFLSLIILIGCLVFFLSFFPCYSVPLLSLPPSWGGPKNALDDLRVLLLNIFKMQCLLMCLSNTVNIYLTKTPCVPSQMGEEAKNISEEYRASVQCLATLHDEYLQCSMLQNKNI